MRTCVDLALLKGEITDVHSIAERQGMPQHYLAKIVQQLARAGIVSTNRGAHGGVRLAVDPAQLTLLRIFEAVEGPTTFSKCEVFPGECPEEHQCAYHEMLAGLGNTMRTYLQSVTVGALAARITPA